MQFIQEKSTLREPQIFIYNTNKNNAAKAAFMLIEILPGIVAMDALGGHRVHGGVIPVEYEPGPIPGIGGPFDTAAAFFEAWADKVKFKLDKETITQMMQNGPISAEEMVKHINEFPSQIKLMAKLLPLHNEGPFPLCHDDFLHSNFMVDEVSFIVTGIID
ncbi:Protein kinase-like domain [Fusarium austroafricanum]|uniref:Protein kinase-like domain n=1 Tax=Fusarium austroafricanum TaxID=2364996 RepID=A0A8H4KR29_9HYPO|nr:Protein kinase-like domain [Fusarium austroafricanum]